MGVIVISRKKINIRFHNPNPTQLTANIIAHIFTEVNMIRVEKFLEETVQEESKKKVTS